VVKRDVPLPFGEIGTHAVEDLVEHTHAVRSSPQIGTVAPPIVARPPSCPPEIAPVPPLSWIDGIARAAGRPDHGGRPDLGPELGDIHVCGPVSGGRV